MQVGYFAIGIGIGADPEVVSITAQTAEEGGFHSLWAPEHHSAVQGALRPPDCRGLH